MESMNQPPYGPRHDEVYGPQLQTLAVKHAHAGTNGLYVLEADSQSYEAQRFNVTQVEGTPLPASALIEMTDDFEGLEPLRPYADQLTSEQQSKYISQIRSALYEKKTVAVVTNHGDIRDIAYVLAALRHAIAPDDTETFDTDLILSKTLAYMTIETQADVKLPVIDLLKTVTHRISLSFPVSESMRKADIPPQWTSDYNSRLIAAWNRQWHKKDPEKGTLVVLAGGGATDKAYDHVPNTRRIEAMQSGTAKILQNVLVVGGAILLDETSPHLALNEPFHTVRGLADGHELMRGIAENLNQAQLGIEFNYPMPDNPNDSNELDVAASLGSLTLR